MDNWPNAGIHENNPVWGYLKPDLLQRNGNKSFNAHVTGNNLS